MNVDVACPNFHLHYYRFVGRVLGRALFSGHLIKGHLVRLLYKHLLGWPVTAEDIRDQDEGYLMGLRDLAKLDDEMLSRVSLDFRLVEEFGDVRINHELVANGANIDVSRDNLASYMKANIRYRLFDRTLPQLTELLVGFYDVVPEETLTVFDANELELLLCGLPHIDLSDWKANTLYLGLFEKNGVLEPVVQWFWEIVTDTYDIEMQARLLQFVTGTSGVPPGGFAALKGGDDYLRKFTIQGVDCTSSLYPKAHTCFNVLDIPNYATKEELEKRLTFSITTSFVGFEAE
jgi:HECT-domain (ubiquitin-transferase)